MTVENSPTSLVTGTAKDHRAGSPTCRRRSATPRGTFILICATGPLTVIASRRCIAARTTSWDTSSGMVGRFLAAQPTHDVHGRQHHDDDEKHDCHVDAMVRGVSAGVGDHHLASFLGPSSLGSPSRTLAALLGGHVRRPSLATLDASKVTARNRSWVLLSDRLLGSPTSRKSTTALARWLGSRGILVRCIARQA